VSSAACFLVVKGSLWLAHRFAASKSEEVHQGSSPHQSRIRANSVYATMGSLKLRAIRAIRFQLSGYGPSFVLDGWSASGEELRNQNGWRCGKTCFREGAKTAFNWGFEGLRQTEQAFQHKEN
jgi:hypothetical protein